VSDTPRDPEQGLIARCLDGDDAAWRALVARYQSLVYSVIRLYFRESAAADDLFQEVCVELYRRLDTIRDLRALPAWLITVTRRKCGQAIGSASDWHAVEADTIAEVDKHIPAIERRFWIEQGMADLGPRDRMLIDALYLDPDQPSYEEIAKRLSMPVSSIGPTRARCLEKLRQRMSELA